MRLGRFGKHTPVQVSARSWSWVLGPGLARSGPKRWSRARAEPCPACCQTAGLGLPASQSDPRPRQDADQSQSQAQSVGRWYTRSPARRVCLCVRCATAAANAADRCRRRAAVRRLLLLVAAAHCPLPTARCPLLLLLLLGCRRLCCCCC